MQELIKIIGREKEIEKLNKLLNSNQAEFLAIYGRRRVGKTFLIRQCFKNNLVFDFSGTKDVSITQQLSNFFDEYLSRTKGQRESKMPTSWHDAFRYLANFIKSQSDINPNQKLVVFIDEMPWIDTPKSEFISALEFFWNQHISKLNNVILVGCGSASSWIRKKLINARGGLYNRVTQRIKLMPFNLHETELFLLEKGIDFTRYQILELYMAMGGIPFYLNEIEKGKSATQSINEVCFSNDGLLHDEYFQLYHSLFKNAENHIKIIETLASKPQGIIRTDLINETKISDASLSRALDELVECDFISIYQPFINKKKEAIYKLTDLYSLFYLKFIKDNRGSKSWEQLSNQSTYTAWSGYAFENICMQHIEQIKTALGIKGIFSSISSWKFKGNDELPGTQIDMLIDRADQVINLCEAKFTKENFVITNNYCSQLKLKKSIFRTVTQSKKAIFTTLLTTYPAMQNKYYLEEIQNEVSMEKMFASS